MPFKLPQKFPTLLLLLAAFGCAVNPATGKRQLALIGESDEIKMGREYDPMIVASFGLVENRGLQTYISDLGQSLADESERPHLPWKFQLIDDSAVNAFAVPGGFIYVTRGILAALNSEAELVGVLGHEVGHITARHTVSQITRQQLEQVGLGVGMIISPHVRQYGDVLMQGLEIMNLSYGRDAETQSDELGVRYMTRTGHNPNALIGVFQTLALVSGSGRLPEWQSTHPYPENRETHIRELINSSARDYSGMREGRDAYLLRLDGLMFGENPREGYFQRERFHHPEMAFRFDPPTGWKGVNQKTVVGAISPAQDAVIMLTLAEESNTPRDAMSTFLATEGIQASTPRTELIHGLETLSAEFSAQSESGAVRGQVTFIAYNENVYQMMGYAASAAWARSSDLVRTCIASFQPETDPAVLAVQPARLEVIDLPTPMTFMQFVEKYPSTIPLEEISRINRALTDERYPAGTLLKRVVGGELP